MGLNEEKMMAKKTDRQPSLERITEVVDRACTLMAFAVHEHVQDNGTGGTPFKSDSGWEDAYVLLEECEAILLDLKASQP